MPSSHKFRSGVFELNCLVEGLCVSQPRRQHLAQPVWENLATQAKNTNEIDVVSYLVLAYVHILWSKLGPTSTSLINIVFIALNSFWNQTWLNWLLSCHVLEWPGRKKPLLNLLNLPLGLSSRTAGLKMEYGDGNTLENTIPTRALETWWARHYSCKNVWPQCSQKTSIKLSTSKSGCGDPVFRDVTRAIRLSTEPQLHWRRAISQQHSKLRKQSPAESLTRKSNSSTHVMLWAHTHRIVSQC